MKRTIKILVAVLAMILVAPLQPIVFLRKKILEATMKLIEDEL